MLVTLFGIVTEVREWQALNAKSAIKRVFPLIVYPPEIDVFAMIKQLLIYSTPFSQLDPSLEIAVPAKA